MFSVAIAPWALRPPILGLAAHLPDQDPLKRVEDINKGLDAGARAVAGVNKEAPPRGGTTGFEPSPLLTAKRGSVNAGFRSERLIRTQSPPPGRIESGLHIFARSPKLLSSGRRTA